MQHGDKGDSQPMPTPNDRPPVHDMVARDMLERKELGIMRYGTALQTFNGRDAMRDLYEEVLDAAAYLRQGISERDAAIEDLAGVFKEALLSEMGDAWGVNDALDRGIREGLRRVYLALIPGADSATINTSWRVDGPCPEGCRYHTYLDYDSALNRYQYHLHNGATPQMSTSTKILIGTDWMPINVPTAGPTATPAPDEQPPPA